MKKTKTKDGETDGTIGWFKEAGTGGERTIGEEGTAGGVGTGTG
jgi:hypothetical protein